MIPYTLIHLLIPTLHTYHTSYTFTPRQAYHNFAMVFSHIEHNIITYASFSTSLTTTYTTTHTTQLNTTFAPATALELI